MSAAFRPRDATSLASASALRPNHLLGVGLVAFVLRAGVILAAPDAVLFADMMDYHVRAESIVRNGRLYPDAWRGPGYPALLATAYLLPSSDLFTARMANGLAGALTAMLMTTLASGLVGSRAALGAGLIVAAYPGLVLSSIYLMPEGWFSLLTAAAIALAARVGLRRWLAAGAIAGVAALTRSVGIVLVPAVVLGTLARDGRRLPGKRFAAATGVLLLGCALPLWPWLRHTTRVSGGPMLDSAAAYNMLAGNNPRATGRLEMADVDWIFETYLVGSVNEADRNRRATSRTLEWIQANPAAWLRLVPLKAGYLWGLEGREHAWVYSVGYFGPRAPATVWTWGTLLIVSFPLLALPAVLGLVRPGLASEAAGAPIAWLLALVTVLHVISFGESRFHLPLVPFLAVLAARGVAGQASPTPAGWFLGMVLTVGLAAAWLNQAPELWARLTRLAAPDGWQSALPY